MLIILESYGSSGIILHLPTPSNFEIYLIMFDRNIKKKMSAQWGPRGSKWAPMQKIWNTNPKSTNDLEPRLEYHKTGWAPKTAKKSENAGTTAFTIAVGGRSAGGSRVAGNMTPFQRAGDNIEGS